MRGVLRLCAAFNRNSEACNNTNFVTWFSQCVQDNQDIPAIKQLYEKIANTSSLIV